MVEDSLYVFYVNYVKILVGNKVVSKTTISKKDNQSLQTSASSTYLKPRKVKLIIKFILHSTKSPTKSSIYSD